MNPPLEFDELHVISDLHLGGVKPFQIFGSTAELSELLRILALIDKSRQVALVINGDFIDFLAEEPGRYFDPDGAVDKLDRILNDDSFKPIFAELRTFVEAPSRTLIVNLGNHDLELALPWVREHLVRALTGNRAEARAKLHLVTDGTGVACRVGEARVLCLHGNEVDSWNVADFEKIRRIGRDTQAGAVVDPWIPNAGTQMVIDVMNGIKRRYPFVDLLKPEKEGVVPTLLALDPSALNKLRSLASVASRRVFDAARMSTGFLGDAAPADGVEATSRLVDPPPTGIPGRKLPQRRGRAVGSIESVQLLDAIEHAMQDGIEPIDLVRGQQGEQLGYWSSAWDLFSGKPTHEVLREALEDLDQDRSFNFAEPDDTFKRLDAIVSPDVAFTVAGHTHLERALVRRSGNAHYFNSGTWARLIELRAEWRNDPVKFQRVFELFKGGKMDALDAEPGLVVKRCSVVSIWVDGPGRTCGELRRVVAGKLQPVQNSRLPKA